MACHGVLCTGMEAEEVLALSPGRISISVGFSAGSISAGFGLALVGFGWIRFYVHFIMAYFIVHFIKIFYDFRRFELRFYKETKVLGSPRKP